MIFRMCIRIGHQTGTHHVAILSTITQQTIDKMNLSYLNGIITAGVLVTYGQLLSSVISPNC